MSTANTSYQPTFDADPSVPAWKAELNAKLAAHRQRRPSAAPYERAGDPAASEMHARASGRPAAGERPAGSSLVAARVAERYAKAQSYSEFLAASAAAAAVAAEKAALAARQAQEAAEAHARLTAAEAERHPAGAPEPGPALAQPHAALPVDRRPTVEHPEPLPPRGAVPPRAASGSRGLFGHAGGIVDAFADAMVPPAIGLPAKLIEFPRELIAAHRSRPRLAEGPLVEESPMDESPSASLRIFEVSGETDREVAGPGEGARTAVSATTEAGRETGETETYAAGGALPLFVESDRGHDEPRNSTPNARHQDEPAHGAPVWQSIRLGEHPSGEQSADTQSAGAKAAQLDSAILHPATLGDRTMAALVDGGLVAGAFGLFVLVFASCTAHLPGGKPALVGAAAILGGLFVFYQWLFMSYSAGTPGMRYARIAICTFEDENPTRTVMRKRVAASVVSGLALGLGFLWALFDEDSLTWHDRLTRSYQRSCL